jgi:hypothetical protein
MQPGYPGSGQDPYGQQPPYQDPYAQPQYPPQPQPAEPAQQPRQQPEEAQQPAATDPYGQPQQPPQYPDPYAQPTSGGPYPMAGYGAPMGGPTQQNNTLGLLAMIFGIVGTVLSMCCWPAGFLFDIAAGVLGLLGLQRANEGTASNRGMALTGVILGGIGFLLAILFAVLQFSGVFNNMVNMP